MITEYLLKIAPQAYKRDIYYAILFGVLSLIFANIKFYVPGYEEIDSNFREIPLLISIFYIRNPLYLIVLTLITTIYTATGLPYLLNFSLHLISLQSIWLIYNYSKTYVESIVPKSIVWVLISFSYFLVFVIPLYILLGYVMGHLAELNFISSYKSIYSSLKIEGITTMLVTTLYLMQLEIRETLREHRNSLESVVKNRTEELALANKTLTYLNENLDDLVKHRSIKIEQQLHLLVKYAHMNSHEVRAPLARMLGLIYIIDQEDEVDNREYLHKQLKEASQELDTIVKSMNRLLEKEIFKSIK